MIEVASSLSIAIIEGVERIFELESWDIALIIPTKLSLPGVRSPKPAINPWVFSNEAEAVFDKVTSVLSAADPTIESKSGPEPPNLVIPIGTLSLSVPLKMVSIPRFFAAVSESSTIIASTKTWALLISSCEIIFLIVPRFASADETIKELVFSWWVITVLTPSASGIKPPEIEFNIAAISADFAYFKYITSMESSDLTSPSSDLSVSLILAVTNSLAETITELDGLNGIAINLLIVGLFWAFSLSNILTASIEDRLSSFNIVILAVLFLSRSFIKLLILSTLLTLSTSKMEFTDGILDRWDCLPVIGLIIGRISSVDLLNKGKTTVW